MPKNFRVFYEKYMNIVGPIGNLMFFIQAHKIFTSQCATSISLIAFLISMFSLTSWLIYGILLKNKPLVIANSIGVVGASLVLISIFIYG